MPDSTSHLTPEVYLEIGGQKRKLAFDFNAICTVNSLTNINLLEASVGTVDAPSIRALLYASLLHDDSSLTLEQVGSWITMRNIGNVRQAIIAAWFASIELDEDNSSGEAHAQSVND